jgi:hypothetical protein
LAFLPLTLERPRGGANQQFQETIPNMRRAFKTAAKISAGIGRSALPAVSGCV